MRRNLPDLKVVLLTALALFGLCGGVETRPAHADTTNYAAQRRQIKAGVLVTNAAQTNNQADNITPYLFYILDKRDDLKPSGWEFVNPVSGSTITGTIYNRWKNRVANGYTDPAFVTGTPESLIFRQGSPLTKNIGAYWEVNLDTTTTDNLQQFDILFLGEKQSLTLTSVAREALRRFVDAGGTLWLENEGGLNVNGSFFLNVGFSNTASTALSTAPSTKHPILNYPYPIAPPELQGLRGVGTHTVVEFYDPTVTDVYTLLPIVVSGGSNSSVLISAGDYGAGHVIVSSAAIASGINNYVGTTDVAYWPTNSGFGNNGAVSGTNLTNIPPTNLKLAYNMLSWISSVPTAGINVRRTNSTAENIGASLGPKWATLPNTNAAGIGSGVVMYKGVAFYVDGANVLHAYDVNPGQDLDGDLIADEGIQDFQYNTPFDEIWHTGSLANANVRFSTPTIVSVMFNNAPLDILVLTDSTGKTYAYRAFPPTNNGRLASATTSPWAATHDPISSGGDTVIQKAITPSSSLPLPMPSPAYSEGVLFVLSYNLNNATDGWRVEPIDPLSGNNLMPGSGAQPSGYAPSVMTGINGLGAPIGSLTVSYVKDDATGALDKIVYVPVKAQTNVATASDTVTGLWFSTRNEPLTTSDNLTYAPKDTRRKIPWWAPSPLPASGSPSNRLLPVIHVTYTDGTLQNLFFYKGDFTLSWASGTGISVQGLKTLATKTVLSVTADYTVDWQASAIGGTTPTAQDMNVVFSGRQFATFNPAAGVSTEAMSLIGSATLTNQDALVFNVNASGTDAGGASSDRVYAVHDQFATSATNATGVAIGAQTSQIGSPVKWMFQPTSGGTVGSDTYNARLTNGSTGITGFKAVGAPAVANGLVYTLGVDSAGDVIVMALRANPKMSFSIGQSIPADGSTVTVKQVDLGQSTGLSPKYVQLVEYQNFIVDRPTGTITIIDSHQPGGDSVNTALPFSVTVGATNQTQLVRNPNTGFGPLDNLVWYMVMPGKSAPASSPTVVGNALYYGTQKGTIASVSLPAGTVTGQLREDKGNFTYAEKQLLTNQTNGNNYATGTAANVIHPPIGATGTVLASSGAGIAAFDNQYTLIADSTRLLEVDYNGNVAWSVDATRSFAVSGGQLGSGGQAASKKIGFASPSVARRTSFSDYLVADTGNDRVLTMDRGGLVTWELNKFNNDMNFLRPGDPLALNHPTDVQTFTEQGTNYSVRNRDTGITYSATGAYYAVHYLVSDSGNYRVIEVVDVYSPNGGYLTLTPSDNSGAVTMQRQIVFVTRSLAEQNARLRYRTVQEFFDPTSNSVFLMSAISNSRQPNLDPGAQVVGDNRAAGGTGGSIVVLNRDSTGAKDGNVSTVVNSVVIVDNNGQFVRRQMLSNPSFLKLNEIVDKANPSGAPKFQYLLCDDNGCYMLEPGVVNGNQEAIVRWMLSSDNYLKLTGRPLRAVSIQKLNQSDYSSVTNSFVPHYLITNGYVGKADNALLGDINGEVFEIRGLDFYQAQDPRTKEYAGYDPDVTGNIYNINTAATDFGAVTYPSIVWMFPKEIYSRTAGRVRRVVGFNGNAVIGGAPFVSGYSGGTSTFILSGPTYSERPY